MTNTEQAIQRYYDHFRNFENGLNGESSNPVHIKRRNAIEAFVRVGFPTLKHEDWRFTNINSFIETDFKPSTGRETLTLIADDIQRFRSGLENAALMVFIDGIYAEPLSFFDTLPAGVALRSLKDMLESNQKLPENFPADVTEETQSFASLNAAFLSDGAYVQIARNTVCEQVIHLLFIATGASQPMLIQPRIHIEVGENAAGKIVEHYVSMHEGQYCTNAVVDASVATNAVLEHIVIQSENQSSYHFGTTRAFVARDSRYRNRYFGFGSSLTRNNVSAVFEGENGEAVLEGLYLPTGTQHMDHFTIIDHAVPHCESHEHYKGILNDNAHAVFHGRIIVRQDAQKTDAKQSNNNLILSENTRLNTKPQLEIYADDVKCTHGATVGRLSEDALFYLRTRGLSETDARKLLAYAFAAELVERVPIDTIHTTLNATIKARLDHSTIT